MSKTAIHRDDLDFAGFAKLAQDETLTKYEKIGFPDHYRQGFEEAIFADIRAKLPRLTERGLTVLDIGPGCSDLPHMIMDHCRGHGHRLVLVDSDPMLRRLPEVAGVEKRAGLFPQCRDDLTDLFGRTDVIICYSVLHYVFVDANPFGFLDLALELLSPGGEMLVADIPNASKRRRFFASDAGVAFHKAFMKTDEPPEVRFNEPVPGTIDDSVVLSLVSRARAAGADAYILPQPAALPMSNRREDLLIRRP